MGLDDSPVWQEPLEKAIPCASPEVVRVQGPEVVELPRAPEALAVAAADDLQAQIEPRSGSCGYLVAAEEASCAGGDLPWGAAGTRSASASLAEAVRTASPEEAGAALPCRDAAAAYSTDHPSETSYRAGTAFQDPSASCRGVCAAAAPAHREGPSGDDHTAEFVTPPDLPFVGEVDYSFDKSSEKTETLR